jgi:hypothetical protein
VKIPHSAATVIPTLRWKSPITDHFSVIPSRIFPIILGPQNSAWAEFFYFMTRKEKIKKLILIVSLLAVCFVLISVYKTSNTNNTNRQDLLNKQVLPVKIQTATLFVNNTKYEDQIQTQMSVYDFMTQLQNEGKINFKDKTYAGMGKFIEEINGIKGSNDKYWIYYVNNKRAEVGVSNYQINPGDVVSWKLEK